MSRATIMSVRDYWDRHRDTYSSETYQWPWKGIIFMVWKIIIEKITIQDPHFLVLLHICWWPLVKTRMEVTTLLLTRNSVSHAWFFLWHQWSNSDSLPLGTGLTWTVRGGVPRYEEICLRLIVAWRIWRFSLESVVNGVPKTEEPRRPPFIFI